LKLFLFILTIITVSTYSPLQQTPVCETEIASTRELGAISHPASISARDGGASALIGDRLLWTFGDTLFSPKSVDGTNLRSNTAGWADPQNPLEVNEPVDANGAPYPFLPFNAEEQQYNDSTGKPDDRIALWPSSVIAEDAETGIVFYLKLTVKPGALNYEFIGTGIAEVTRDNTSAVRDAALLFTAPEPTFDNANLIGSDVYLYGNAGDSAYDVARVPCSIRLASAWS